MAETRTKMTFNPVKEEEGGKRARRVIWSTAALEAAYKGLEKGKRLIANPFYENDVKLLKSNLLFERTEEEISEWLKCRDDILYFVEKYCKFLTPEGIQHVTLRDYQKEYLKHLIKNRLSILLSARQAGKTVTSAVFMLHYILFNVDKNALVLGNKLKTAKEILDKAKKIFQELPFFLRPGIEKWNETEIVLDNGCRLMAESTTINSGISYTFHCVLADEFAHVQPNILDSFYNNLFPTITAARARFMITSTQNGYNLFCQLYTNAVAGNNEYAAFKVDWWQIPEWNPDTRQWEKRTEQWRLRQIANLGSEEAFNKQFGTSFNISANTLINHKILSRKQQYVVEYITKDMPGVPHSDCFEWDPDIDIYDLKSKHILITSDISECIGEDSTVYKIHMLTDPDDVKIKCIGYFKTNMLDRESCAKSLLIFISKYLDQNQTLLSWEKNTYGDLFLGDMRKFINGGIPVEESIFVKFFTEVKESTKKKKQSDTYTLGIKITKGNKTPSCMIFKEHFESDKIIDNSVKSMNELTNFTADGNGNYKASFGHDDMVMCSIQLELVMKTIQYKLFVNDFIEKNTKPVSSEPEEPDYIINYNMYSHDDIERLVNEENTNRLLKFG